MASKTRFPGYQRAVAALAATFFPVAVPQAQWSHPGCEDVTSNNFKFETMVQRGQPSDMDLNEPLKMAFDRGEGGAVDIYYVERKGKVKAWNGATRIARVIGQFQVAGATGTSEDGLLGIALDPGFKANKWIYLFRIPADPIEYRLSRFTLVGSALDMQSEKVLLRFVHDTRACCHNGGAMQFDAYGDLWLTTGGNGSNQGGPIDENAAHFSEEDGASSTADYRGGVLRIHPDDSPRGYSIPKGNFGEFFAEKAMAAGNSSLASQYRDTAIMKPEIYIKGGRNPYTLTLDPVRRWITTGDVGPDNRAQMEEHNLYKSPAFSGWPYFAGRNLMYRGNKDADLPTNTSKWNRGMKVLPPATPAIRSYVTATAITGPIYRYDGDLQSPVKFPPHFNRKWFISEFQQNWMRVLTLDEHGTRIERDEPIFQNYRFNNPIDVQMGPDGAMYVINYAGYFSTTSSTSIVKISYSGNCRPPLPKLELPATSGVSGALFRGTAPGADMVFIGFDRNLRFAAGITRFELFDLQGRKVWEGHPMFGRSVARIPESLGHGLFMLRLHHIPTEGRAR